MTEIISVRFKEGGKSYYFNPNGLTVAPGDRVIIETSRGVEFGECVEGNRLIDEMELVSPLRPVVRKATEADFKAFPLSVEANQQRLMTNAYYPFDLESEEAIYRKCY